MTLTKADIADSLYTEFGLAKALSKQFVDDLFECLRDELESGHDVKLTGFGNFELRCKNERPGRNPKTGEPVAVSARRVVIFKVGQKLRSQLDLVPVDQLEVS